LGGAIYFWGINYYNNEAIHMNPTNLIATDLDRTLLRSDITISNYTMSVLKRCKDRGIKLVFATARPKNRVDIFPFAYLADAIITDNGAAIYINNEMVESFGIAPDIAKPLIHKLAEAFPDKRISIEYPSVMIANFEKSELWNSEIVYDIARPLDIDATKIVIAAGAEIYDDICALLPDGVYAQLCEGRLILIMRKGATKWNAISAVAKRFGISSDNIAAFGDDLNDIEMISKSGCGVAVANAIDAVKAVADYICGDCDGDGLARWVEGNLFIQ
jgi:Cof subfamily protein (haloacid dehalogenase superfamily)